MDAMRRFNRVSAVICLLLACAPVAIAQDFEPNEILDAAVPPNKLAGVYEHGSRGPQNPARTVASHHKAAAQGDVEAQYNLAKMYEDQDSVLFDYSKAHSWYRMAATNGHRGAQSRLGLLLEFGKGVAQSRVQAHMWYSIAFSNGNKAAAFWRDSLAADLEPYEILTAQILAQECLSSRYRNYGS
jgi:hypothetical protein